MTLYDNSMNENVGSIWSCNSEASRFPVVATVVGVVSCFAESLLKKHVGFGPGFEVALALTQVVPFAIVLRYLAVRLRRQSGLSPTQSVR